MQQPHDWECLMHRFATAVDTGIGIGTQIENDADPFIQMAIDAPYALGNGDTPAGTLADFFSLTRHLPNFLARSCR